MVRKLLERDIERHFCESVRKLGGIPEKFRMADRRGVPDRIVLFPGGLVMFCELKRPGEVPRPDQVRVHRQYGALGSPVAVLDSVEAVDAWVDGIRLLMAVNAAA